MAVFSSSVFFKLQIQKLVYSSPLILALPLSSLQSCSFKIKWLLARSVLPEMAKSSVSQYEENMK